LPIFCPRAAASEEEDQEEEVVVAATLETSASGVVELE